MTRLRWKLLAAMLAVVGVTVATSGLFTRRITHQELRRVRLAPPRPDTGPLLEHHQATGGWSGVDRVLDRMPGRLVLTDRNRRVLAVSTSLRQAAIRVDGDRVAVRVPGGEMVIRMAPVPVGDGLLYLLPPDEPIGEFETLDRRLVITFTSAALVAVLLTILLSRRITRPVERLTAAAEEMARGGKPARMAIEGRDEIAKLARAFDTMAGALARQQELRRRMVSDVAHELRTPLTNLRCELEAIEDGLVHADGARIASLREEVLHLGRLVDDLQELAVAESGGLQLAPERIDLGATVARVAESFAVSRPVEVSAEEVWVDADPLRIGQVVRNLLSNAFRHARTTVRVTVTKGEGEGVVTVADDGPGIPEQDLPNVFERFYRVDAARARSGGGAGLGLAIVRELVTLHGGRVYAENGPAGGAILSFTIPSSPSSSLRA